MKLFLKGERCHSAKCAIERRNFVPGQHGNGRKVDIPSFIVKPNDEVAIRESSKNNPTILAARDATAHAPSPSWMDVDRDNLKGKIMSMPRRDELVQIPINEQLIVELYSK